MIEFPDYRQLFRHLRLPHVNDTMRYAHLSNDYYEEMSDSESVFETSVGQNVSTRMKKSKDFECDSCRFQKSDVKSRSYKYNHYITWHSKPTLDCTECDAKFNKKWQWAWHLKFQHDIIKLEDCLSCGQSHEYYKWHKESTGRITAYHIWDARPIVYKKFS